MFYFKVILPASALGQVYPGGSLSSLTSYMALRAVTMSTAHIPVTCTAF